MERAGVRFRSYGPGDAEAMYALDVACFDRPFRFTRGAMRRFAEARRARVVVAEERGAMVGFVIVDVEGPEEGGVGYVVTLDVDPAFRRRGIARALMAEAEGRARREGCTVMVLHAFTGNGAAMEFYARVGFVRTHRVEGFYGAGRDAWVCVKELSGEE